MEESIAYENYIQPHLHNYRNLSVDIKYDANPVRLFK